MWLDVLLLLLLPLAFLIFVLIFALPRLGIPLPGFPTFGYGQPKIVCVGDNLTFGTGSHLNFTNGKGFRELSGRGNYTAKLAKLLHPGYKVLNYAFPNATVIEIPRKDGTMYATTPEFRAAIKVQPNIVVIMLGTVDTAPSNWRYAGVIASTFRHQLHSLVENFLKEASVRLVVLCHPPVLTQADIVAHGRGGLAKESAASKGRTVDIAGCVKQVMVDIDSVIQIKQKLQSSATQWKQKKVVFVDMHERLVIKQRQTQQLNADAIAVQTRAVKRALEKVAKKDRKQGKLTQAEVLARDQQLFHTARIKESGVGLTPAGAAIVADSLANIIWRNYGRKKVPSIATPVIGTAEKDLDKVD